MMFTTAGLGYSGLRAFLALTSPFLVLLALTLAAPASNQALLIAEKPLNATSSTSTDEGNNCEAQIPHLNGVFQEALEIAKSAITAIELVQYGRDNWLAFSDRARISGSLLAMYGITTGGFREPMMERDARRVEEVLELMMVVMKGLYRSINVDFGSEGDEDAGEIPISCDDECLDHAGSSAYSIGTGDRKQCLITSSTSDLVSLSAVKRDQAAIPTDKHIEAHSSSLPLLMLQSLADIMLSRHGDVEHINDSSRIETHGYSDCAFLAARVPEIAIQNAENYKFFALNMWLDEIDWANGFARQRPDTDDDDEETRGGEENIVFTGAKQGGNLLEIDMAQAERAREMIDGRTAPKMEYQARGLPKPRKHSSFVAVGQDEVAEL